MSKVLRRLGHVVINTGAVARSNLTARGKSLAFSRRAKPHSSFAWWKVKVAHFFSAASLAAGAGGASRVI
jgi:hypothetical protein